MINMHEQTATQVEAAQAWIAVLERAKPRVDRGRGRWLRVSQTNRHIRRNPPGERVRTYRDRLHVDHWPGAWARVRISPLIGTPTPHAHRHGRKTKARNESVPESDPA